MVQLLINAFSKHVLRQEPVFFGEKSLPMKHICPLEVVFTISLHVLASNTQFHLWANFPESFHLFS